MQTLNAQEVVCAPELGLQLKTLEAHKRLQGVHRQTGQAHSNCEHRMYAFKLSRRRPNFHVYFALVSRDCI